MKTTTRLIVLALSVFVFVTSFVAEVKSKAQPPLTRVKKHASDQRIAELQALIAMKDTGDHVYGHGHIDPFALGRRKRINYDDILSADDWQRERQDMNEGFLDEHEQEQEQEQEGKTKLESNSEFDRNN